MAYVPLPQYKVPAGINFEPVNQALEGILQQQSQDRQFGLQQKQIDATQSQRQFENARATKSDQRTLVQDYGKAALAIDQLQGPQRASAWQQTLQKHTQDFPGQTLSPEEMDPVTGPKLLSAQAGQYVDPMVREQSQADLDYKRAQTKELNDKANDPVVTMLLDRQRRSEGAQSPAASAPGGPTVAPQYSEPRNQVMPAPPGPQRPQVQPQSYNAPQLPPGIQLTSDTSVVPGAPPQQPQSAPQQAPDQIDTPYGRMSRQEAKTLGGAMLLNQKYAAAGKALLDSAGGAADPNALDKTAANQNDKEELGATSAMATLNSIKSSFDPKYLNIPNRLNMWGKALADKFGSLSPQDQKDLAGYTQFRQRTWANLNKVLKDLSGTAVTENEMQRQLLDQPNAGQGIADGDSPTEFATKLTGKIAYAQSAIARSRYLRNKGFTGIPWSDEVRVDELKKAGIIPEVDQMPAIINQRGAEIEQQLRQKNPNADPMQLQQAATRQIKQEFGI